MKDYRWLTFCVFATVIALTMYVTYRAARKVRSASDFYAASSGITGFQNGWAIAGDYLSAAATPQLYLRVWQATAPAAAGRAIPLGDTVHPSQQAVAYAARWVTVPASTEAVLRLSTDAEVGRGAGRLARRVSARPNRNAR